MTERPPAPNYTNGETARVLYLLIRGALAAVRGQDPADSKWHAKLSDLAQRAREREGDGNA